MQPLVRNIVWATFGLTLGACASLSAIPAPPTRDVPNEVVSPPSALAPEAIDAPTEREADRKQRKLSRRAAWEE